MSGRVPATTPSSSPILRRTKERPCAESYALRYSHVMSERHLAEREWVSWLIMVLWSLLIFATIPVARAFETVVVDAWGQQFFSTRR